MELPEPITHRIQSFLTGKEAAKTTVLSKSWNGAWLTRPDLDFDEKDHPNTDEFLRVVKMSIQRYVQSNLKIDTFGLHMSSCSPDTRSAHTFRQLMWSSSPDYPSAHPVNEFIVKALEIGATRLTLRQRGSTDFVLPNEVLESENLVELHLKGCRIDDDTKVRCWRLESFSLNGVHVKSGVISDVASHCHLIKKLTLSDDYNELNKGSVGQFSRPAHELHNITSMLLSGVKFNPLLLGDLLSKFLSLKELTLEYSHKLHDDLLISNDSLEVLNFSAEGHETRVEFDVPSIRKFKYKGQVEMSLSFAPTAREWESHVSLKCPNLQSSWFPALHKLLTGLCRSAIYLSLDVHSDDSFDYEVEDIRGLPKHEVRNVTMDMIRPPSLSCYALFDGLFRICHPNFITQCLLPQSSDGWKTNNYFLCKTLGQKTSERCSIGQSLLMYSLDDLKEASVDLLDEVDGAWQDLPWKSLLDAPCPTKKQKIRFRLGWN